MTIAIVFKQRYLPHVAMTLKPRTVAEYERLAKVLLMPKFGASSMSSIALEDVEDWHASIPGKVQANRAVSLLSGIYTFVLGRPKLAASLRVTYNPCNGFERWNAETGKEFFYAPEQAKAIMAASLAFPDIRGRYIAMELLTGCRPNELRDVAQSWHTPGALRTPDHKGRRNHIVAGRNIYLSPQAEAILEALTPTWPREGAPDAKCYFPAEMDLRRAWDRIVRLAGVPRARQYDLRHTFASAALAAKQGIDMVGLMLGHKKRETTLKYVHLSPDIAINAAAAAAARMGV